MIKDLRKIVKELKESEAKSLLLIILLKIKRLEESGYSSKQFSDELYEMYKELLNFSQIKNKTDETYQIIHIVFGNSSGGALKVALRDLDLERKEKVIVFFDDIFSIGPIWKLQDEAGRTYRYEWLRNHINLEDDYLDEDDYEESFRDILHQINAIPEQVPIIIWNGENAHEQTGVRYALYLLHKKTNDIFLINTLEAYKAYFNNSSDEYFPLYTAAIDPEKLKAIYEKTRLNKPLLPENRMRFVQEWESLANKQEVLRIWQDGEIQSVADSFYDQYIINTAQRLHNAQKEQGLYKIGRINRRSVSTFAPIYWGPIFRIQN
ncbi:Domain of unknown function DUF1835 [Desulfofarcimen acetoxidans DSM 771]|uniref:DUF1835 domain-containing protein n=1 Tax=Desulfofarcimen acetoxidans (strain ATCC 49208 / DSM 771 / KCTC 5769 / VKM B-1644 / 5575) TaxID=485916 RepID=C8W5Z3_DESAS|nr:DUF1835 domain-containing protein [Desulfofarcimen acetoxidans]ACV61448.1 Domain of unknown function DUF1835 [Desulfofarcimen acetoxidans DSM 771]